MDRPPPQLPTRGLLCRNLPSSLKPLLAFVDDHLLPPSLRHLLDILAALLSFPADHPLHETVSYLSRRWRWRWRLP
ncbi:hypothetical protein ACP4OV_006651 [Aristida adscensionis]